jgi:undecaprenyl-diphosphatase
MGLVAWVLVRVFRADITAPKLAPSTVAEEVRHHRGLARWLRSRADPTVATGSLLTGAVAVAVVGGVGVGIILAMVRTHRGFADFDLSAARWGAHHATSSSTRVLRLLTQFGGAVVLVPLVTVFALVQARRLRHLSVLAFFAMVVAGQYVLAAGIKAIVDRTRPDIDRLTGFNGPSFPSGHATAAAAVFMAAALVAGIGYRQKTKAVLAGAAAGGAAMIAASRVFLGVHWLTDVLAGLCLGWAWFALCSVSFGGRLLKFGAPVAMAERVAEAEPPEPVEGGTRSAM